MFHRQRDSWKILGQALSQRHRNTRVWKDLPGRVGCGLRLLPTHHGKVRAGKPDRSGHERCRGQSQRQRRWGRRLGLCSLAVTLVFPACFRPRNPQVEFEHVQGVFLRGDLTRAQSQAEVGWRYYSTRDPQLSWEYRILDARVLTWRGMYSDVLPVLSAEFPSSFYNTDLDFQRRTQVAHAYIGLHRLAEA